MRLSRADASAELNAYGDSLAIIYRDWVGSANSRGISQNGLVSRLQQAAESALPAAYMSGKRRSSPDSVVQQKDKSELRGLLNENERALATRLSPAISTKLMLTRIKPGDPDFVTTLEKAFTGRVRSYGGVAWRTMQMGYLAGYRERKSTLTQDRTKLVLQRFASSGACAECVSYSGIYEDDAPLPGEGICGDQCRCFLELTTITEEPLYTTDETEAA